jgi:hypothetical protein
MEKNLDMLFHENYSSTHQIFTNENHVTVPLKSPNVSTGFLHILFKENALFNWCSTFVSIF